VKALYTIVVYLINATTGDLEREIVSSKPLTLEQCNLALIERGPVPVKDGQATFMVCRKDETVKVSI
jgi:hypothetical protein